MSGAAVGIGEARPPEPSAFMTKMLAKLSPSRSTEKAILLPSGLNTGLA
jgi:hypothetical protein